MATGTIISNNWTLVDTITVKGGTVTLPSNWTECLVVSTIGSDLTTLTIPVLRIDSGTQNRMVSAIWGANSATSQRLIIQVTDTTATLIQYGVNASENYNALTVKVYAR